MMLRVMRPSPGAIVRDGFADIAHMNGIA